MIQRMEFSGICEACGSEFDFEFIHQRTFPSVCEVQEAIDAGSESPLLISDNRDMEGILAISCCRKIKLSEADTRALNMLPVTWKIKRR